MLRVGKSTGTGRTTREAAKLITRRVKVFDLYRAGHLQKEIARSLKISQQTVSTDIQLSLNEWRENHRGSIAEHTELELKRINMIETEAQRQYETCCLAKPEERKGNPSDYLRMMLDCSKERRKLLGIDSPSRHETKSEVTISRTFKTREEMKQEITQGLERFRQRVASQN
jgi:hypothetical protein